MRSQADVMHPVGGHQLSTGKDFSLTEFSKLWFFPATVNTTLASSCCPENGPLALLFHGGSAYLYTGKCSAPQCYLSWVCPAWPQGHRYWQLLMDASGTLVLLVFCAHTFTCPTSNSNQNWSHLGHVISKECLKVPRWGPSILMSRLLEEMRLASRAGSSHWSLVQVFCWSVRHSWRPQLISLKR